MAMNRWVALAPRPRRDTRVGDVGVGQDRDGDGDGDATLLCGCCAAAVVVSTVVMMMACGRGVFPGSSPWRG